MEFVLPKSANACIFNTIFSTLYLMSKQNFGHIYSSVSCHLQNCTWLTCLLSNRVCIFIGDKDKSHYAQYSISMFVQYQSPWILCILLCMGFTVLHSEYSLFKAVVAHYQHSFIQSVIHMSCLNQYSMCITTFSLSLTLCCCSLKFFTVETAQKVYWNIPHL